VVDAVIEAHHRWNTGDRGGWIAMWHPDAVIDDPVGAPTKYGLSAVEKSWEAGFSQEPWFVVPGEIHVCGNAAAFTAWHLSILDAIERADGEAFCAQVVETALQLVAVDPARPAFVPWQTPTRRYTDNGLDSVYGMAFVDDRHRYRIHGARADECYLSVSLYAA